MKATKFNITIASIANYCTIPNMEFNGSLGIEGTFPQAYDSTLLDLYGNSGWAYLGDAGIRAAIDRVNNDPNILPNIHVNLKRFTDCGAYYPEADLEYWGNSAGYASAVTGMEIVYDHTDVIGVIGNEFSSTAAGVVQILGNNKIPYCAASMASPRYSNKDVYPFFWRLFPNSFARGMLLMLQKWKVRRVAIVYQLDQEIGYAEWAYMKILFSESNIQVITSIGMRLDFDSNSADMCKETLLRTDARSATSPFPTFFMHAYLSNTPVGGSRYIVVSGTSQFGSKVVYEIGRRGVFGHKFVWMTFNLVYGMPSLGPDYYQYLEGLVTGGPCIYEDAPNKPEFLKALRNVMNETFDWRTYTTLSVQGYFDCTMIMLLGLHLLHADPVELSERKAQTFMNYTLFQDLNYFGYTTLGSTKLDSRGDVQMPICFTRFTGINDTYRSFGFSSDDSLSIVTYNEAAPKFYGGASIPPPDGPPITEPEYYSLITGKGQTLLVMSILGISASLFCVGFILYNSKVNEIKASIVPEMVVITIGCLTSYASLLLYISAPTSAICKSRATLPFVSLMLVAIPLLLKNMTIIWLFSKRVIVKARVMSKMKCTAVLCELVILAVDGTMLGLFIVHSKAIVLTVPGNNDSSYFRCSVVSDTNSSLLSALYVFNALIVLLLLAAAYASTRVTVAEYSEVTQLTFIPLILIIAFALEKGIQSYSEDANLDFKIALIHWCLTTAVLYFMIGKRMLVVYRNWRLSAYEKRIAADASQPKQSVAARG
ncbi:hypothetical protein HDU80_000490 [Chytriomyces hyalinus]|nr:hypothetical protein HDU80_000490 [Chytriomyces hyalinus]